MRGLKDYISEQNQEVIITAIRTLKEELDFDSTAINHLQLAIYLFQTAVNEVLRMHSIKPHWMFALDNLVRNAVQAAITVLSPGEFFFFTSIHTRTFAVVYMSLVCKMKYIKPNLSILMKILKIFR